MAPVKLAPPEGSGLGFEVTDTRVDDSTASV